MDIDICTWCIFRTINQWHAVRQSWLPQSSFIYHRVASHCCCNRFDNIHLGEKTATVQRIGCIRATATRSRAVISWKIVSPFLLVQQLWNRERKKNFVHFFVVQHRKYGSAVSSDQSRTCSLSDVMVSNGMSHKNCDSWSRLVSALLLVYTEIVYWMDKHRINESISSFECSRCEQDGRLTRNSSYYGSCVDGMPQRVPCTVERETIAWNGHELHSTIVDCTLRSADCRLFAQKFSKWIYGEFQMTMRNY